MVCRVIKDTTLLLTESGLHSESALSRYFLPVSGLPVQTKELLATGRPRSSTGTFSLCAARRRLMFHFKSSGASAMKSRQNSRSRRMLDSGHSPSASTTELRGCSLTSNSVTTPKLPPPPRRAQNKSELFTTSARSREPSAVTSVKASTLSQDNPNLRVSHPVPPPRTRPPAPVCETTPEGKTRPAFWVAVSIDPSRQPPAKRARLASGSTATCRMRERSITMPPSQVLNPARLCPPQRTAVSSPVEEAARTAL